jgi:predicted AlkP superfamily phosphohydrolase/phosphomutase
MTQGRVLVLHLDGFDEALGRRFMDAGKLPALARLRERSARLLLRHGEQAIRTGLAGEHFATGLLPEDTGHWSDVYFDPRSYGAWQVAPELPSFVAGTGVPTVVFDPSHFSFDLTPEAQGLTNWGTHGPGVPAAAGQTELLEEVRQRFGAYPATDWLFGFAWPSAKRCRSMAEALVEATRTRAQIATWLLGERSPDWRLGIVTSSELHAASEAFWHGVDQTHPLHRGSSTTATAAAALQGVYVAVDEMVARLEQRFDDATIVVFAMGGMGPNRSDLTSMALLPELMFRRSFGKPFMEIPGAWKRAEYATLGEDEHWVLTMKQLTRAARDADKTADPARFRLGRKTAPRGALSLSWMPAMRYQPYWRDMDAFALPSFTDGRIRVNLRGRESDGRVAPEAFESTLDQIEEFVRSSVDPRTGESVVSYVERLPIDEALAANSTACDLMVGWKGTAQAFDHPVAGRIGPLPFNRSGGHTGPHGFAYIGGDDRPGRDLGETSSFDVVPTVLGLLGVDPPPRLAGRSAFSTAAT